MPQLYNVGPIEYQFVKGAATLSFTPLPDRGAKIRRIGITVPSASDTWVVVVAGKEIMRLRVLSVANMNVVRLDDQSTQPHTDFFSFCRRFLGMDPSIPVPQGQVCTITSVGGATANIVIEFTEWAPMDINSGLLNSADGSEYLIPIYTSLAAAQSAAAVVNDDTQIAPAWLPNFLIGTPGNPAWKLVLLAMFLEGAGVNTFSGAANHQSTTNTKRIIKNSVSLGARTTAGIPNLGAASAAGSANTVFGQVFAPFNAWEKSDPHFDMLFDIPITLQNGDLVNVQSDIIGDLTGGASYANVLSMFPTRVSRLQ